MTAFSQMFLIRWWQSLIPVDYAEMKSGDTAYWCKWGGYLLHCWVLEIRRHSDQVVWASFSWCGKVSSTTLTASGFVPYSFSNFAAAVGNSQMVCVPPAWILNLLILLFVSLWLWKATCSGNGQFSLHLNTHLQNGKLYIPVLFTLHFSLNFFPPFLLSVIQFDLFSVTSWGGGESNVDRTISESSSKRQRKDSWDDEYDKGKVPCWLL